MPSMVSAIGTIPRVVHPDKGKGWEETLLIPAENLNILHFRFFGCSFFFWEIQGVAKGNRDHLDCPQLPLPLAHLYTGSLGLCATIKAIYDSGIALQRHICSRR